jgi:hypothetical protein
LVITIDDVVKTLSNISKITFEPAIVNYVLKVTYHNLVLFSTHPAFATVQIPSVVKFSVTNCGNQTLAATYNNQTANIVCVSSSGSVYLRSAVNV